MLDTTLESVRLHRTPVSMELAFPPIRRNLPVSSAPRGASLGPARTSEAASPRILRDPSEGPLDHLRERGRRARVRLPHYLHHGVLPANRDRVRDDRSDPGRRWRGDGDLSHPSGHLLRPPWTEGPAPGLVRSRSPRSARLRLHDG